MDYIFQYSHYTRGTFVLNNAANLSLLCTSHERTVTTTTSHITVQQRFFAELSAWWSFPAPFETGSWGPFWKAVSLSTTSVIGGLSCGLCAQHSVMSSRRGAGMKLGRGLLYPPATCTADAVP